MEQTEKKKVLDKLSPQQQVLVEQVLENLEQGAGLWKQGWTVNSAPESAVTGKKYRGMNNFFLTLVALSQGYQDNRWATFKQMEDNGWKFKTDEEGKSMGKGAGVSVEFYTLHDKETKKPFDKHTLDGMNEDEKHEYMKENVFPIRKFYRVFNADLIDGIPEIEKQKINPNDRVERADKFLQAWSDNEAKIYHGGDQAYYSPKKDEIHLPRAEDFISMQEYYSAAFHETGHSTGHESRLNREIANTFGTPAYAEEELRAEIASMFLGQEFGVSADANAIRNNSAYIQAWKEKIQENPNVLFTAIADANNISKYIVEKEQEFNAVKEVEHYAIVEDKNVYDETVYKLYMTAEYGQTRPGLSFAFSSKEALLKEFENMQKLPFWKDKTFVEVSKEELDAISIERAKSNELEEVKLEPSDVYKPPSEVAAKATAAIATNSSESKGRGIDSLTRMDDREIVERASKTKNGTKFNQLYNGISVLGREDKDEYSLMTRLAMFVNGDKEQLIRIFQSSKQFREGKPMEYYETMAEKSLGFVAGIKGDVARGVPTINDQKHEPKSAFGRNTKV